MTQTFPNAPTKKTPPWGLIISIIVGFIALIAIGIYVFVTSLMGLMKNNGAYEAALAQAQNSPQLERAIGSPMEPSRFVSGSIHTTGPAGDAELSFKLTGPNGEATIYTQSTKAMGEWTTDELAASVKDGERIMIITDGTPVQ